MASNERKLREALGRFTTGVCVVAGIGAEGHAIGMTINSFSSVSLEPSLVQWSLKSASQTYRLFSELTSYSISILSDAQLEVSRRYARAGDHRMQQSDYEMSTRGTPYVRGALAYFACRRWQTYCAGDHSILLGAVENFAACSEGQPLVFYQGGYYWLAAAECWSWHVDG
jgi:flavin reductase (DIM6/NTAB) family NADH-FMN oxidoreductase RutF